MNADPAKMGLGEFDARIHAWNERRHQESGDGPQVAPPTSERMARNLGKIPAAAFGRPN